MRLIIGLGIGLAGLLLYLLARSFLRQNAITAAKRQDFEDLLNNEKYQVKGRFD